ncbi:MAG: VOC family protein [Verrucomicrobiota bacterium]
MAATLQLTHIALRVSDLARSRAFYVDRLGFVVVAAVADRVTLATAAGAESILTLLPASEPVAEQHAQRPTAGLFHAALLFPSRPALASWLAFAAERQVEFDGFSDHGVSEALYFSDPDGNGLEFYADRPKAQWPYSGSEVAMGTLPLDVQALLAGATPTATPLAGAVWGHLHLRVTDLARSERYYRETLGVVVTQSSYPGARFLAADGYHHHLGLNTWGNPHAPQPAGTPGLAHATFAVASVTEPREVSDPDAISLRLEPLRQ